MKTVIAEINRLEKKAAKKEFKPGNKFIEKGPPDDIVTFVREAKEKDLDFLGFEEGENYKNFVIVRYNDGFQRPVEKKYLRPYKNKKADKETDLSKLRKLLNTKYLEDAVNTPKDKYYAAILGVKFEDGSGIAIVFTFKNSILTEVVYEMLFTPNGKKKEIDEKIYHGNESINIEACVRFLKEDFKRFGDNPKFVSVDDFL